MRLMEDENEEIKRLTWSTILSLARMALLASTVPTKIPVEFRTAEMMARYVAHFPVAMCGVVRLSPGSDRIWAFSDAAHEAFGGVVSQLSVFPTWIEAFKALKGIEQVMLGAAGDEVRVELRLVVKGTLQDCSVLLCASERDLVGFRVVYRVV
jgi:hypothetical protein